MIKKLYWKAKIFWLCLKAIGNTNLGDHVVYNGARYVVINGTRPQSWDLWNGKERLVAPRSECKKELSFKGAVQSFKMAWHFYMTSWFDIWCRVGVEPWMRNLRIWQDK